MSEIRGQFVWNELNTTDPNAAMPFYKKVVGWGVKPFDGTGSYYLWQSQGTGVGGLMPLPEAARNSGAPPSWLTYIGVDDVDGVVAQAKMRGAREFVPPTDIPSVGRFAVLADPQGAAFAVMKPLPPGAPPEDVPVGDFSWHELVTTDWKSAWEFYRALFGWEHESSLDMGPDLGTYFMFKRPGGKRALGGMYNKSASLPAPAHWLPYARVTSADKAAAAAQAAGGQVIHGPADVPGGGRIAMMIDPQGAAFAVHATGAAAAKPKAAKQKAKAKPQAKAKRARPKAKRAAKQAKTKTAKKTAKKSRRRR